MTKQNEIDISKLDRETRVKIARELILQEIYLTAAIRMTRRNLRTPLLKRNRGR